MRKSGSRLGSLFYSSTLGKKRCLTAHLQQVSYTLPLTSGASCSLMDAQRLFLHTLRMSCTEGGSECIINDNAKVVFDDCLSALQAMGILSVLPSRDPANAGSDAGIIQRAALVNVDLCSIEIGSRGAADREEREMVALFQLLHGVLVPLLHSKISTTTGRSTTSATTTYNSGVGITDASNRGPTLIEGITAESCILQLQQLSGSRVSLQNNSATRFITDLVNEAILLGVRDRVLHSCGNGLFCLHRDVMQQTATSLLAMQWWWWRRVAPLVRQAMKKRVDAESSSPNVWLEVTQAQVLRLIRNRDETIPRCLASSLSTDAAMAFVADSMSCWSASAASLTGPPPATPPRWQIRLSDEARAAVALCAMQSFKSCLARRPAGVSVSELGRLVSWPLLSSLLCKRSLLKALAHFSSHFVVTSVEGILVVQQQLTGIQGGVTPDEAAAWVLSSRNTTQDEVMIFLQEVDLVVRAVAFLWRRQLRHTGVNFGDLLGSLMSPNDTKAGDVVLDVLHRYDVVEAELHKGKKASWESVKDKTVRLSAREVRALNALENFRKKIWNGRQLYTEAIEPFLSRCTGEAMAGGDLNGDASMPLVLLERWIQLERLQLLQTDLLHILYQHGGKFPLNEATGHIHFDRGMAESGVDVSPRRPSRPASVATLQLPPPPPAVHPCQITFETQLSRVRSAHQLDALFHFAQATVHAVFTLLLPHVSAPSGLRLQVLLRRVRWASMATKLGPLSAFVEAFDGLFFDVFGSSCHNGEGILVAAHRGPVGAWLLYARLIARLFPSDIDIPLGLMVEGLSWNVWFAPRFGDLAALLRRVGRSCHHGYLLEKTEATLPATAAAAAAASSSSSSSSSSVPCDDASLWEILEAVRHHHHLEKQHCIYLKLGDLFRYARGAIEGKKDDEGSWVQLAAAAVLRLPLFLHPHTALNGPKALLRVTLPHATASSGLVALVEGYICPLLRQHQAISIAELDHCLGWTCGGFDCHPTGIQLINGAVSGASLCGVLRRYVEGVQMPLLMLDQGPGLAPLDDGIMVRPNTAFYRSPEDMLLEVNGLEFAEGHGGLLRPTGRPVSLFEVLAEERELLGDDWNAAVARTEQWHVSLQCKGDTPLEWEEELTSGRGDITVWCET